MVHADDGLDELSTIGPTRISELKSGEVHTWYLESARVWAFRMLRFLSDLQVSEADESAQGDPSCVGG